MCQTSIEAWLYIDNVGSSCRELQEGKHTVSHSSYDYLVCLVPDGRKTSGFVKHSRTSIYIGGVRVSRPFLTRISPVNYV